MTPLRADAQRNLERVLEAAALVFSERGADASVDEIARRAGVGNGTVFRRFPTKDALIAAVVQERVRELTVLAEAAAGEPDPGTAFHEFVWQAAELHARNRGLFECLDRCVVLPEKAELAAAVSLLVERAQAAGAVRSDMAAADVQLLLSSSIQAAPGEQWRRYVEVVLAGLSPPAAT